VDEDEDGAVDEICKALPPTGCRFALSNTTATMPATASNNTVTLTASPTGCSPNAWTATSQATWLSVGASGSGGAVVAYSVTANSGAQRTGTVTIAAQVLTVTQAAGAAPPSGGFPTAATTGIPAGTTLRSCGSTVTLSTANAVIDGCTYTGNVTVTAQNVTIKNSRLKGQVWTQGSGSYTLLDSDIGPDSGCNGQTALGFGNYTAKRVKIHNFGDGVRASGSNIVFEDSLILGCSNAGDHADGVQGYQGGTNIKINHNTIDLRAAAPYVTSPIFFADNSRAATVTNNLLLGGGYTLRIHDDFTPDQGPWVITGNRIGQNSWVNGPVATTNTECNKATWSDNRLVTVDANYTVLTTGALVNCGG
jgi:hypothetical protein